MTKTTLQAIVCAMSVGIGCFQGLSILARRRVAAPLIHSTEVQTLESTNSRAANETFLGRNPTQAFMVDTTNTSSASSHEREPSIKVPFPVFVTSLFKSGTTTVHNYFTCGHQKSVHYSYYRRKPNGTRKKKRTGPCIMKNVEQGTDFVQNCGNFDAYSDNANVRFPDRCFEPTIHGGLENFYKYHPKGTIFMAVREPKEWVRSVNDYYSLGDVLKECTGPGYFQKWKHRAVVTDDDLKAFYLYQLDHVRQFVAEHASLTYVEVPLDSSEETKQYLEETIGISATCWGHGNQHPKIEPSRWVWDNVTFGALLSVTAILPYILCMHRYLGR